MLVTSVPVYSVTPKLEVEAVDTQETRRCPPSSAVISEDFSFNVAW